MGSSPMGERRGVLARRPTLPRPGRAARRRGLDCRPNMGERWAGAADPLITPRMGEFQTVIVERCTNPASTRVAGGNLNDHFREATVSGDARAFTIRIDPETGEQTVMFQDESSVSVQFGYLPELSIVDRRRSRVSTA
jgi:hypothetical protein